MRHTLSILAPDALPTEVRLFVAGVNETENGSYIFDARSAAMVMAAFEEHGVDRMFDLEHLSLDPNARNFDPDARGWCRLELRADGSLWAVDIRWTPDGERRLREKTQRYISPAFEIDPETRRVTKIVNVAITAMPATHQTPALVAARKRVHTMSLSLAEIMLVAKALDLGEEATLDDFLAKIGAMKPAEDKPAEEPAAEPAPEAEAMAAADPAAPPAEEDEEDKPKEYAAAARTIMRLTAKPSIVEAVEEVEEWRKSHLELASGRAKLAADRAALEGSERRKLVAQLVAIGKEIPATAFAKDADGMPTKEPCARLAAEPIGELRARVALYVKASGGKLSANVAPPTHESSELSKRELAMCAELKVDPKIYAANKAAYTKKA